tara:strand:- start:65027 stop:65899 length:873 start_codon:yes stop_codon:yes gene_type:complete
VRCKEHGTFETTPVNHLKSKNGCYKCYRTTPEDFRRLVRAKGFSTLSFPNIEKELDGKSVKKIITVTCSIHGTTKKNMNKVLSGKHACLGCFHDSLIKSVEDFSYNFQLLYKGELTCDMTEYKSVTSNIKVSCKHHGTFYTTPHRLINHNQGCRQCGYKRCSLYTVTQAERNKDEFMNTPSGLYVLKLSEDSGNFNYKLGISKDIKSRMQALIRDSGLSVEKIFYRKVDLYTAISIEQDTFSLLHEYLINDDLKFAGYTERFYMGEDLISDFIEYLDYQITSSTNMENAP